YRSSGAALQEIPSRSSSRTHFACPTSTSARGDRGVRPSPAPARSTAEFRSWHWTTTLRQTTPALDAALAPRKAFHVPSPVANRQSTASRNGPSGIPLSTERDLVDARPACNGSIADSPRSRRPTAPCRSCRATQAEVAARTNAERNADDPASRKHPV